MNNTFFATFATSKNRFTKEEKTFCNFCYWLGGRVVKSKHTLLLLLVPPLGVGYQKLQDKTK
jgi:hypothetical protein